MKNIQSQTQVTHRDIFHISDNLLIGKIPQYLGKTAFIYCVDGFEGQGFRQCTVGMIHLCSMILGASAGEAGMAEDGHKCSVGTICLGPQFSMWHLLALEYLIWNIFTPPLAQGLGWLSDCGMAHIAPFGGFRADGLFTWHLASFKVRISRESVQRDPGRNCKAFYDLASEILECHFLIVNYSSH